MGRQGVSNLFSSGARMKTAGAQRPEVEGFTEARSAERGRVGEGKLPQNGAFWGILEQLMLISKPKIYIEKMSLSTQRL